MKNLTTYPSDNQWDTDKFQELFSINKLNLSSMEKATLFQYAIIWHPDKEQEKKGEKSKVIVPPATILAKSQQVAQMIAIKAIPEEYAEQLEQVDIALRPF